MADARRKRKKKGAIGEEDVCNLLQRYKPDQVLALLREVSQSPNVKIDWNAVVKKPEIEITSARECQMLWRHLAYLQPLADEIAEGAHPLDDDSDLEYEVEASPAVSIEFTMEVANCVKVLASGSPNESSIPNVKGDMPNGHSSKASSETRHRTSLLHGSKITAPVYVEKQPQAAGPSNEALDANGSENSKYPPRRKRKHWSYEEDLELIAAVKKFGEGNWANMVKCKFKGDRSASQLSQRWALIRKKEGRLIMGGMSSQLSEAQLATRRAIDMALKDNLAGGSVGNGATATGDNLKLKASNGDTPTAGNTISCQPQNSQVTNTTSVKSGPVGVVRPRLPLNKAPTNTIPCVSDPIQAAAVAAGARIVSRSDAATLIKATQSKNAVHIRGGNSSIKNSATRSCPLPPNVHFIRTGLVGTTATSMGAGPSPRPLAGVHQAKGSSVKHPVSQVPKTTAVPPVALDRRNSAPCSISVSVLQQKGDKTSSEVKIPVSDLKPVVVQEDNASSRCLPKAPGTLADGTQTVDADNSQCATSKDTTESECKNPLDKENWSTVQGSCDPSVYGSDGVVSGASTEKIVSGEADKSNQMDL